MDFVPLLAAVALVWKIVDFAKFLRAGDTNGAVTQGVVWGAGVAVAFLLAYSDFSSGIEIGGATLGDLNPFSIVLIGLSMGSAGSVGNDFKKAFDRTDTAATPALLTGQRGIEGMRLPQG